MSELDIEEIIGFDALYDSMHKCKKGVMRKTSVAHYVLNSMEETYKLCEQLEEGTYKARRTKQFTITSPKKREIVSICFRDRVYQRSINDNALYPIMTKSFIRDNWACQKGKGTDDAISRVKCFLQRMYRKYGTDFYILQVDIHGYYPNMQHSEVNRMFRRKIDGQLYTRTINVLDGQYAGEIGYNPGSQMVQIVGISFLDGTDHYMSENSGANEYGRYMDDSLLCSDSLEVLESCEDALRQRLDEIGLEFNPKKTKIHNAKDGFVFLGFRHRVTDTGKVIMLISPENVKRERGKLRRLVRKAKKGEITKAKVDESYASWKNHASKGNSFKLLCRMDEYYKNLWR